MKNNIKERRKKEKREERSLTKVQKKEHGQKEAEQEAEQEAEVESSELEELQEELEEKRRLADDYLSRLKYLQAEFENYKKMVARERERYEASATEGLVKSLLPIIDSLESGLATANANVKRSEGESSFVKGIELIYKDLMVVLGREGLKPIKAVGEQFDPYKHEVVTAVVDDGLPEDTVVEELERGFLLGSKVIRTAKVKVSKAKKK